MGTALAAEYHFDPFTFSLVLSTALLLQILTNLANDYGDTLKGTDANRPGPARQIQSGEIPLAQVRRGLVWLTLLCALCGALLVLSAGLDWHSTFLFLMLGLLSIIAAITYTVGTRPYGYRSLGDLSVFLFFGLVAVAGSFYLQARQLPVWIWLPAIAAGLLSVCVLNINNIRDMATDREAGKRTLALLLGKTQALNYFSLSWIICLLFTLAYALITGQFFVLAILLLTPLFFRLDLRLRGAKEFTSHSLVLVEMVKLTFGFELLFAVTATIV